MAEDKPVTKGSDWGSDGGGGDKENPYNTPHIHADDPEVQAMQVGGLGGAGGLAMSAYAVATDQADAKQRKKISRWAEQQASSGSHGGRRMLRCNLGELKKYHKQVGLMAEAAEKDIRHAKQVADAQPTAQDVHGSVLFANQLGKWGDELVNEVQRTYNELKKYSDHLDAVIKSYQNQEDDTEVTFKNFQGRL